MSYTDNFGKYTFDNELKKYGDSKDELHLTWIDIAAFINSTYAVSYSDSFYRKRYTQFLKTCIDSIEHINDNITHIEDYNTVASDKLKAYENILRDIKKERAKLSDERTQNNAYVRRLAREDTLKDIAKDAVANLNISLPLVKPFNILKVDNNAEAILVISDWHYGLECNNAWNTYNPDVALERINKLQDNVCSYIMKHDIKKLTIVNLSDLICGRIHLPLRIESRLDVISQTMKVSEILAEFINNISQIVNISYYDCEDNHSRIEPNKDNSLHIENFTRIIKWFINERLKDNPRVFINIENEYSEDIITFYSNGYRFAAVHGDKDKMSNIVENLSLMTHEKFDVILTAHMHHFAADEVNETVILQNGTLMGTDRYAQSIRKTSTPSQLMLVTTPDNPTESIHRILL